MGIYGKLATSLIAGEWFQTTHAFLHYKISVNACLTGWILCIFSCPSSLFVMTEGLKNQNIRHKIPANRIIMNLTTSTVDLSTTLHLKSYNLLTGESQQALKILFYDEPEYALSLRKVCAILNARRPFNLKGKKKKKKHVPFFFSYVSYRSSRN